MIMNLKKTFYSATIIVTCCLFATGCESAKDKDSIFNGEYAQDVAIDDSALPEHGRIYRDALYYREIDGQKYIAVNLPVESLYSVDDIESLSVGDDLQIDRDLTIHIDKLDYDPEWEDLYSSEEGTVDVDGTILYRKKGRLLINDHYYFAHPAKTVGADGNVYCQGGLSPEKWIFGYRLNSYDNDSVNVYSRFDNCVWAKVSDDCKVRFILNRRTDELTPSQNIKEILVMMDQYGPLMCKYEPFEQQDYYYFASLECRIGEDEISRITIW